MACVRWAILAVVGLCWACEPECDRFDVVRGDAVGRPDRLDEDVDLLIGVGSGGIVVDATMRDFDVFEPLRAHVISGDESAPPGVLRFGLIALREYVLVVELPLPLERDQVVPVDTLLSDLVFTGGQGTTTWWDAGWSFSASSTTAPARAVLTQAFERALTTSGVQGAVEVRESAPLTLRVGLSFDQTNGERAAFWSDVRFEAENGVEACP